MADFLTVRELYECKNEIITPFLNRFEYPWEALSQIKDYICSLIESIPEGYTKISEDVIVGENVKIYPTATVEGPAIIGSGSVVRPGAFIRGCVIIGEECVIGNSTEIKNSILLDRVQAPHYNYVGDSVLGNRAHLGAGSICSNLKSDGKNVIIHADTEYETGLRKVGAFLGDGADVGCGCVLNPGTVIGKNTSVYPMTALRGIYPKDSIVKGADVIVARR